MRIATWNVERLKSINKTERLLREIEKTSADILVLTETDDRLKPDYPYCYKTPSLNEEGIIKSRDTENRVSVYTRYKCIKEYKTNDEFSSVCVELQTELGNLIVYGTVIGALGNRDKFYKSALKKQIEDINKLSGLNKKLCIAGDYNQSFGDNYYFTKFGRETIQTCFSENHLKIVTSCRCECIDHIAISDSIFSEENFKVASVTEWNYDKDLSDHKGIMIEILREDNNNCHSD